MNQTKADNPNHYRLIARLLFMLVSGVVLAASAVLSAPVA